MSIAISISATSTGYMLAGQLVIGWHTLACFSFAVCFLFVVSFVVFRMPIEHWESIRGAPLALCWAAVEIEKLCSID